MPTHDDVRRIAASLPGAVEAPEGFSFSVSNKGKPKGFLWTWLERVHPKKARVPNPGVVAIMVKDLDVKEILINSGGPAIFTESHYNNFPAVLVRLEEVGLEELEDLVVEGWRCKAPKDLIAQYERERLTGSEAS